MARRRNISTQTKALMAALLEARGDWRHGYELSKLTGLKSGTLYPVLMRLADQGLLESKWEPSPLGRPPRHVYRLTAQGVALAQEQAGSEALDHAAPSGSPA